MALPKTLSGFILTCTLAVSGMTGPAEADTCPHERTLVAGIEDYRPYHIIDGPDQIGGMDFDVLELILERMGCDLEKRPLPWIRHLNDLKEGRVDIASPVARTPEREVFARYSEVYLRAPELLFVHEDKPDETRSLSAFFEAGNRLGIIRGYVYGGEFVNLSEQYPDQITAQDSEEPLLRQLEFGRVDAVIGDLFVMSHEIKKLGLGSLIVPSNVIVSNDPLYFMFSRKSVSEEFVLAFNNELNQMRTSGELDRIIDKYRGRSPRS